MNTTTTLPWNMAQYLSQDTALTNTHTRTRTHTRARAHTHTHAAMTLLNNFSSRTCSLVNASLFIKRQGERTILIHSARTHPPLPPPPTPPSTHLPPHTLTLFLSSSLILSYSLTLLSHSLLPTLSLIAVATLPMVNGDTKNHAEDKEEKEEEEEKVDFFLLLLLLI